MAVAKGRCAGCGAEDALPAARRHTLTCQDYLALYKKDPELATDPLVTYLRHRRDHDPEAAAAAKDRRWIATRDRLQEAAARRHAANAERWRGQVNHTAVAVSAPADAVLTNAGRTDAQRELLAGLGCAK